MKSGFGTSDTGSDINDELQERIRAILMTFMRKAVVMGGKYASSAGRDILTSTDLLYALQYQAHRFLDEVNSDDNIEEEFNNHLLTNTDDEEYEEDEENEEDEECEEEPPFTRCELSDDDVINDMNHYHDNWDSWNPTDSIQIILKRAIDEIEL